MGTKPIISTDLYRYASTLFPANGPTDPDRCPGAVPPGLLGREVRVEAGGLVVVCPQKTGIEYINLIYQPDSILLGSIYRYINQIYQPDSILLGSIYRYINRIYQPDSI